MTKEEVIIQRSAQQTSIKDVICIIAFPLCLIKRLTRQQSKSGRQMFGLRLIAVVIVIVAPVVVAYVFVLRASGGGRRSCSPPKGMAPYRFAGRSGGLKV